MLDKILINCATEELAKELMEVLDNLGIKWCSESIASSHTNWERLEENTVYCIENNTLEYSGIKYFKDNCNYHNHIWYTAEEFINKYKKKEIMRKEDLKPGMVVEYRTKTRRLLVPDCNNNLIAIGQFGYLENLNFYNEDLYYINNSDLDIIKVYSIRYPEVLPNVLNDNKNLTLLWERKEPKEYTMQEIANKLGIPVEELRIKK